MTIDETIEFSDRIYDLAMELENKFFDWDTYPFRHFTDNNNPVRRDCINNLYKAFEALHDYALGFKELQFCK